VTVAQPASKLTRVADRGHGPATPAGLGRNSGQLIGLVRDRRRLACLVTAGFIDCPRRRWVSGDPLSAARLAEGGAEMFAVPLVLARRRSLQGGLPAALARSGAPPLSAVPLRGGRSARIRTRLLLGRAGGPIDRGPGEQCPEMSRQVVSGGGSRPGAGRRGREPTSCWSGPGFHRPGRQRRGCGRWARLLLGVTCSTRRADFTSRLARTVGAGRPGAGPRWA